MLACWVNGVRGGALDPMDRGLHYGDGLFETMCVTARGVRQLEAHLGRLRKGCERLSIPAPALPELRTELATAAAIPGAGVIKLIVTRGAGGRGYRAPEAPQPTRVIAVYPPAPYPQDWSEEGVALRYCTTTLSVQPAFAGLKHLNRLEQVHARGEWTGPEPQEGLMSDAAGRVVCGTMSNLFIVSDGVWSTPSVDRCGVAGTMRAAVLAAASGAGIACLQRDLVRADLEAAEELFVTNAVIGAWPVKMLAGVRRRRGPAVAMAQEWIRALS